VGGTHNHIHLVINIEPSICISDFVGELKGWSSYEVNKKMRHKALDWQRGYGAVSFGKKQLEWVKSYVRNQKEHHSRGTTHARLEAADLPEPVSLSPAEARSRVALKSRPTGSKPVAKRAAG
jgi:hypothetical protein